MDTASLAEKLFTLLPGTQTNVMSGMWAVTGRHYLGAGINAYKMCEA